jgi:histidinol phosphatase-like enzyme
MEKIKVIFLDLDGVLNVYCEDRDEFGCTFHSNFVDNLKRIIEKTGAKIVISSSWRKDGLKFMLDLWKFRNLPGEIIDLTSSND